ncbi:hypothetical protein [Clostridium cochlearium]|uniref:hypothetical protein n=1 Tax=Clostridium cochlearium TaxID=1494 RepID=UPI00156E5F83|nr:hypothetical protein [Clostridium cochlearium]MBV1820945.1 hypothetical protein [Bacteroidales bacterium MSK.15.36]MCG4580386.1 hypothetical protein [Clostridium cochlearium]NSJ90993.1 hypothetical protein [Coprococcus sp. MSK.21.13]
MAEEKHIEFNYGDVEQFIQYKAGENLELSFPSGVIFFVGNNEGMVLCNKIKIYKEEMGEQVHTKLELSEDDKMIGAFFAEPDKDLQIILSSDDTMFKAVFIYNVM